jgi:hypothetical protein
VEVLNVRAAEALACVADAQSGEITVHGLPRQPNEVVAFYGGAPGSTLVAYEAIDGLPALRVPSHEEEQLGDLVRACENLRGDRVLARHWMGKLLSCPRRAR